MADFIKTFTIAPNFSVTIKKLISLTENKDIKFLPIANSAYFKLSNFFNKDQFFLPKLYAALTYVTGPCDDNYDSWKGSYSFSFDLTVEKNDNISNYYYHIFQYRSYINFDIYQIVPKTDSRNPEHMQQPNDELFSDYDICFFSRVFCDYVLDTIESDKYKPKPFVKYADSNLLLFGFSEGEYFLESYKDCNEYKKEKEKKI